MRAAAGHITCPLLPLSPLDTTGLGHDRRRVIAGPFRAWVLPHPDSIARCVLPLTAGASLAGLGGGRLTWQEGGVVADRERAEVPDIECGDRRCAATPEDGNDDSVHEAESRDVARAG